MQKTTEQGLGFRGVNNNIISLIARRVSAKYLAMAVDWAIAIFMIPFNLAHLGQSAYGLWMLVASVPVYFSLLDLGYGAARSLAEVSR